MTPLAHNYQNPSFAGLSQNRHPPISPVLHLPLQPNFCFPLQVVREYERAIVFRLGRLLPGRARGPGKVFTEPPQPCVSSSSCSTKTHLLVPFKQTQPDSRWDVFAPFLLGPVAFNGFSHDRNGLRICACVLLFLCSSVCQTLPCSPEQEALSLVLMITSCLSLLPTGLFFFLPCLDTYHKVDLRLKTLEIPFHQVWLTLPILIFGSLYHYFSL